MATALALRANVFDHAIAHLSYSATRAASTSTRRANNHIGKSPLRIPLDPFKRVETSNGATQRAEPTSMINSASSVKAPTTTGPRVKMSEAAPLVHLISDVGFKPLQPGQGRRFAWPLFGMPDLPEITPEQSSLASSLFQKGARYLGDQYDHIKPGEEPKWTEIVVVGRSNVGKSTLLNQLLGSRDDKFVKVSRNPGSTTHLDWYGLGTGAKPSVCVVDTPGYGFSVRGKTASKAWLDTIASYLFARSPNVLGRTLILMDARTGMTPIDREVISLLEGQGVPWHAVLTKADAVSDGELEAAALTIAMALDKLQLPYPVLNAVSARSGEGLKELQQMIVLSSKLHKRLAKDGNKR